MALCLRGMIGAVAALLTQSVALGQELPSKADIVAKWQLTELKYSSVALEWTELHVGNRLGEGTKGQRESASNWTLYLLGNDFKATKVQTSAGGDEVELPNTTIFMLDKRAFMVFRSVVEGGAHPGAIVDHRNKFTATLELRAPFLFLRPGVRELSEVDVESFHLSPVLRPFNGKEFAVLAHETEAGDRRTEYWLDPKLNFTIGRQLRFAAELLTMQLDLDFEEELSNGSPILEGWTYSKFQPDGTPLSTSRFEVSKLEANPRDIESLLSFKLPIGTLVNDHTEATELRYIVRSDDQRRVITDAEQGGTYEEWMSAQSEQPEVAHEVGAGVLAFWVIGGIVALAVCAILIWVFVGRGGSNRNVTD